MVRKNAPLDKLASQLGGILRDQCKVEVELRVVEEVQDVFVVSGTFELKPPSWREKKILDIYATEEGLNKDYDHFDPVKQRAYTGPGEVVAVLRHCDYVPPLPGRAVECPHALGRGRAERSEVFLD